MSDGDFRSTEQSVTVPGATSVRIEHVAADGSMTVLRDALPLQAGEVIDASVMRAAALQTFLAEQIAEAKEQGVLFSVHLKATMMKVSDPIIFGHAVRAYFADVFAEHGDALRSVGVNPNDGLGALLKAIEKLPEDRARRDRRGDRRRLRARPRLAMVDSDRGITNLHVPSDVIIDASMPAAIRSSGQMWNAAGELQDTKFVIPDHSYAPLYAETVDHCREHGAFDPATMGTTPNVGLMAQAAEEYGSHDKTFEISGPGTVRVVDGDGRTLLEHEVATGDIWRMCQTKDAAIQDWVRLAVARARETGAPRSSGSTSHAPTTPSCSKRSARRSRRSTPTGWPSRSSTSPRRPGSRSSGPVAARTRSRSPATSCATTSPTCSRSSSSGRARRCSRSCR